jgi:hypothetical protein
MADSFLYWFITRLAAGLVALGAGIGTLVAAGLVVRFFPAVVLIVFLLAIIALLGEIVVSVIQHYRGC